MQKLNFQQHYLVSHDPSEIIENCCAAKSFYGWNDRFVSGFYQKFKRMAVIYFIPFFFSNILNIDF